MAFGRVGYGTSRQNSTTHSPAGPLASAGFYNGYFQRAGASYTQARFSSRSFKRALITDLSEIITPEAAFGPLPKPV